MMLMLTAAIIIGQGAPADTVAMKLHGDTDVVFASQSESAKLLARSDVFTQSMSDFDRQSRVKSTDDVTEAMYCKFAATHAREWNAEERAKVSKAIATLREQLKPLSLKLPKRLYLVKTSGDEEGDAAYCRNPAIILPAKDLKFPPNRLLRLVTHELFHVLSRHNPELRDRLYAIIGFQRCGTVTLPAAYRPRRITNPDAPLTQHKIELDTAKGKVSAVPVLFASVDAYAEGQGTFFKYLQFKLMEIERDGETWQPKLVEGEPHFFAPRSTTSFLKQIGENTTYIIHPEEILADNFVALVAGSTKLRTPRIVDEMRAILTADK